ncbi:mannose-1-phosphate guanylyltransferase [Candidatus Nanosynbacter lyticus]|uniref:mannose-1-phosphate guanylyltransferase n=1 Tax=Candidatus Nanosynbacter lyticus TaxID=2093824 RepID=UPI002554686B|nr:sugar phosphate nucleotidyltransferase [Candidatus Nanosynbacter lyticus]WLD47223.1 NTP transferase domain-containing protein [Candidatus Nanosynbacter lyticus]
MIAVIIAGGSGTRLWPLSTSTQPKQLLALTSERTMVQQAYDRARKLGDTIYVVTEASHAGALRAQLPELPDEAFLIEPGRRGTAHCIVLALDYINRHHDRTEPIAFIHSDHNVRDVQGFAHSFATAARISRERGCITLIGIEPTFPSTGFGYIQRDGVIDAQAGVYNVESFKEKPNYETAKRYVESGNYLWNCGYFVGSVEVFMREMQQSAPDLWSNYQTLASIADFGSEAYNHAYLALDNQVIDIALIEKAHQLAMVSASFDWMDIGNFKDLHDAVAKDESGNYAYGDNIHAIDVASTYIRNEQPDKPVAVIGLDNVVVVNTPDGVLVARRDVAAKCGDIAKKLQK